METFIHAAGDFIDSLGGIGGIGWTALLIALGLNFAKVATRPFAWRNIIRAAYPGLRLRRRSVFGAYVAGVGVNAIVPARGGDLLKLFLVKRGAPEVTYTTLGATLLPETLFDSVAAGGLILWGFASGALPGLDVLPDLPRLDWHWVADHPSWSLVIGGSVVLTLAFGLALAERRIARFWQKVGQGFAILRHRRLYLRQVVPWQAVSWVCRIGSAYFFLRAFHLPATVHNALVVTATQSISTLLPFTPGGVGTVQGLLLYVFRDLQRSKVLAFAVGMHIVTVIFNAAVGFLAIFLMLRTLRWRQLVKPEERLAER